MISLSIHDAQAMERLGQKIWQAMDEEGMVIYLKGDLGAGKTTFVRGLLRAMGYSGIVKSPTYTLVEPYVIEQKNIYHFDFYRINDPQALEDIGLRDYFQAESYCLIEWPEKAAGLPLSDLTIEITINDIRHVIIKAHTLKGQKVLRAYG